MESKKTQEPMTGWELLLDLAAMSRKDLDKPISMEGCDCYGECYGWDIDREDLTLRRQ